MAWIEMVPEDAAEGDLAELYEATRDPQFGRVDNIMAIHSLHPAGLRAHHELYREVMSGTKTLRKVEREMIALVTSLANSCHY
jgi:alkylhydroperoxidase family enzyme